MTQEDFIELQSNHQKSGLSLKLYLQQIGISYTTYNYWRKKLLAKDNPNPELAPISFTYNTRGQEPCALGINWTVIAAVLFCSLGGCCYFWSNRIFFWSIRNFFRSIDFSPLYRANFYEAFQHFFCGYQKSVTKPSLKKSIGMFLS